MSSYKRRYRIVPSLFIRWMQGNPKLRLFCKPEQGSQHCCLVLQYGWGFCVFFCVCERHTSVWNQWLISFRLPNRIWTLSLSCLLLTDLKAVIPLCNPCNYLDAGQCVVLAWFCLVQNRYLAVCVSSKCGGRKELNDNSQLYWSHTSSLHLFTYEEKRTWQNAFLKTCSVSFSQRRIQMAYNKN